MTLPEQIAKRLRLLVDSTPDGVLPSVRYLSAIYGVSVPTISRALALLRNEGLVSYSRGRRIRKGAPLPSPPAEVSRQPARERCRIELETAIANGTLRAGAVLGKVNALAKDYGFSHGTIIRVLKSLSTKGLVHKRQNRWIAGPRPPESHSVTRLSSPPPVLLLFQDKPRRWSGLAYHARTARFCLQFSAEAERYGVQVISVYGKSDHAPGGEESSWIIGGVKQRAVELGERLLGALVVTAPTDPQVGTWINTLLSLGKPVVWFDGADTNLRKRPESRHFTRCHFCEKAAIDLAVTLLNDWGHKAFLYPYLSSNDDPSAWRIHRGQALSQSASCKGIECFQIGIGNSDLSVGGLHSRKGTGGWIRSALSDPKVTAIVAPRDHDAFGMYHQIISCGLEVPGDVSLISFDNYAESQAVPVSTIDFGMGHLGYCAFHVLFGAVRISRNRNGDIPSKPHIVDRGSMGPPRRHGSMLL